jgi:hypothetical protein
MLSTLLIANQLKRAGKPKSKNESKDLSTVGVVLYSILFLVLVTLLVLKYIGTCTIFARANPRVTKGMLVVVFFFFLFFGDFYLFYFAVRWGVNGVRALTGRRVVDYRSLPYPRSRTSKT